MATVYRPKYTVSIPAGAKLVEKDGRRFARFRRRNAVIEAELTELRQSST
jgi:hypothetical protein